MTPAVYLRPALAAVASLLVAAACASAARTSALPPATPEECARFAQGYGNNGINMLEKFDSLLEAAQRRDPRERPKADPGDRLDRNPALINGRAIAGFMSTAYPPDLLFGRRGGTTMMAVLVAADGSPARVRVFRTSGIGALDLASVRAAEQFRFTPGVFRGCPVYVFSVLPVTWNPGPPPQGAR